MSGVYKEHCARIFSREGPQTLRAIRARARQRTGRLVSFAELAEELRAEIESNRRKCLLVERATEDLLEALRSEKLTAFGQRRLPNGDRNPGAPHDAVPIEVLIHPHITIELWNQLTIDSGADTTTWQARKGTTFDDVRFKTVDILHLWPAETVAVDEWSPEIAASPPLPDSGASMASSKSPQMDSCTLTDAIGRVAYGDNYDRRYYAAPGEARAENESRHRRRLNRRYPTNSGLPGISNLAGLRGPEFDAALKAWELADDTRWGDAEHKLLDALLAGKIKAFDETGNAVPAEFWLSNNLHAPRARAFRLRADDLRALGQGSADTAPLPGPLDEPLTRPQAPPFDQEVRPSISTPEPSRPSASRARAKMLFQSNLFRAEYMTRVARWESADGKYAPPSPKADRKWAEDLFHTVPRSALRDARRELAPDSWKRRGKRSGLKWPE